MSNPKGSKKYKQRNDDRPYFIHFAAALASWTRGFG
jgi:hypothetical protein